MVEKRKHKRFKMNSFVAYKPNLFSGEVNAVTKDVSLKGTCFFSEKKLKPGKIVTLKLYHGAKEGVKKVRARIIYSKSIEDSLGKAFFNGVEFLDK